MLKMIDRMRQRQGPAGGPEDPRRGGQEHRHHARHDHLRPGRRGRLAGQERHRQVSSRAGGMDSFRPQKRNDRQRPLKMTGEPSRVSGRSLSLPDCCRPHLQDQHRVAVAEEAILLRDRLSVRPCQQIDAGEGTHQQQQSGARQVEIGEQGVRRKQSDREDR